MKRDMKLIRKVLFQLEARKGYEATPDISISGYDRVSIRYHLLLLAQAGLIDFEPEKTKNGRIIAVHVFGLNWAGHEFLDAVRSEKIWRRLLKYTREKGGSLPFELLKTLGVELLKLLRIMSAIILPQNSFDDSRS